MGLFDFFVKKPTNSSGERLDRLTPDGELPWGWVVHNKGYIEAVETAIQLHWDRVLEAKDTEVKYHAYRESCQGVQTIGSGCEQDGECQYKWFCEYVIKSDWYDYQLREYSKLKASLKNGK